MTDKVVVLVSLETALVGDDSHISEVCSEAQALSTGGLERKGQGDGIANADTARLLGQATGVAIGIKCCLALARGIGALVNGVAAGDAGATSGRNLRSVLMVTSFKTAVANEGVRRHGATAVAT